MKKLISSIICLLMLFNIFVVANANTITENDEGLVTSIISYGASEKFVVYIPPNFVIDEFSNTATAEVSASNVIIDSESKLEVTIVGNDYVDKWELIDDVDSTNRLEYIVGTYLGGNDIVNNGVVLSVPPAEFYNSTKKQTLYFEIIEDLKKAGTYTDMITFFVSVVPKD